MNPNPNPDAAHSGLAPALRYFPAILCDEHDSPIDALVSLCVPRDEATDLVAASWAGAFSGCILAVLDGGRHVAVLAMPDGRWAACNAFLADAVSTAREAERRLGRLLKRGRRGYVGVCALEEVAGALPRTSSIKPIQ